MNFFHFLVIKTLDPDRDQMNADPQLCRYVPGGVGGVENGDVPLVLEPVERVPEGGVRHRRPQRHRLLVLSTEEVVASKTHTHSSKINPREYIQLD